MPGALMVRNVNIKNSKLANPYTQGWWQRFETRWFYFDSFLLSFFIMICPIKVTISPVSSSKLLKICCHYMYFFVFIEKTMSFSKTKITFLVIIPDFQKSRNNCARFDFFLSRPNSTEQLAGFLKGFKKSFEWY